MSAGSPRSGSTRGELVGAVGLTPPPLAATGLALITVLATLTRARRKEPGAVTVTAALPALARVVARGRFDPYAS